MRDRFDYDSPYWIFGKIADWIFLESYMRKLLEERNELIKKIAESEDWRKFQIILELFGDLRFDAFEN